MKAKVICNPNKQWATRLLPKLKDFLKKKGAEVASSRADFTVIIGGDGTIFFHKGELEGPTFGIGGSRSFICNCTEENWEQALSAFLANPSHENRVALLVKANGKEYWAINDAAILSRMHEMLELSMGLDGEKCEFVGDGLIISTPTGSTAYAYSAGGPVIEQSLPAFAIVPVAPYKRLFDSLVVSSSRKITLSPKTDAHLVIDGHSPILLKGGEKITIQRHEKDFLFALPALRNRKKE